MRERLILAAAVLVAFGITVAGSFHLDDYALFTDPAITSPSGWSQVWRPAQSRPLTYFTFWLNYQVGGRDPAGYHAVNLALHLSAVLAVWEALRRVLSERAALIAAALFAVHPIQTEAVAYVFARATLLMTLFCALSLAAWWRGRVWIATAWFALALLAKEECPAFPLFLWLLRREWKAIGAMLALALAAGVRVVLVLAATPRATAGFGMPVAHYAAVQGWVILRYLRLLFVPWGFSFDPDIRPEAWQMAVGWVAVAALAAVSWRCLPRQRAWILGGLILLIPSSSIFPAEDLAADRRMYLPMVALCGAAGLAAERWRAWFPGLACAALAVISMARSEVWRTEQSLWAEAEHRSPHKLRPKLQLARAAEPLRALELLRAAEVLAPEDTRVASQLGRVWLELSRPDLALAAFGRALALEPGDAQAVNNRGAALLALGQQEAARADFERALRMNPCLEEARENLRRMGVASATPPECR